MATKCNGCGLEIYDISYMECSEENCKKLYHLKCLTITENSFESFTQEFKDNWHCPECKRNIPKRGNSDTPVRGHAMINQTFTPSGFVNTQRGTRCRTNELEDDEGMKILAELREFRLEMRTKMKEQTEQYESLKSKFISTESELQKLRNILKVVQEKVNKVDTLEITVNELKQVNERLEARLKQELKGEEQQRSSEAIKTFANVTKCSVKQAKLDDNSASIPASQDGAMKTAELPIQSTERNNEHKDKLDSQGKEKDGKWTTVMKKNRYPNKEVRRGDNIINSEIQGTERKKFLHVWRLKKETTQENIEKHVRNICGQEVALKVDKIKHKTERDYASFIIGVPESQYEVLCQTDKWPLNIEFCEWVWFRKSVNKSKNQE
jgi:hypothetical protein